MLTNQIWPNFAFPMGKRHNIRQPVPLPLTCSLTRGPSSSCPRGTPRRRPSLPPPPPSPEVATVTPPSPDPRRAGRSGSSRWSPEPSVPKFGGLRVTSCAPSIGAAGRTSLAMAPNSLSLRPESRIAKVLSNRMEKHVQYN